MSARRRAAVPRRGPHWLVWVVAAGLALLVLKWLLITAFLLAGPFAIWWCIDRATRGRRVRADATRRDAAVTTRRGDLEALAVVDAAGGCGWCGSRVAHRAVDGRVVLPAEHHRLEIDAAVAA